MCAKGFAKNRAVQDGGVFSKKTEAKSAQEQMLTNPDMMQDMMKKNFSGIVPQVGSASTSRTLNWKSGTRRLILL